MNADDPRYDDGPRCECRKDKESGAMIVCAFCEDAAEREAKAEEGNAWRYAEADAFRSRYSRRNV
jgi:hypothetical protein